MPRSTKTTYQNVNTFMYRKSLKYTFPLMYMAFATFFKACANSNWSYKRNFYNILKKHAACKIFTIFLTILSICNLLYCTKPGIRNIVYTMHGFHSVIFQYDLPVPSPITKYHDISYLSYHYTCLTRPPRENSN